MKIDFHLIRTKFYLIIKIYFIIFYGNKKTELYRTKLENFRAKTYPL